MCEGGGEVQVDVGVERSQLRIISKPRAYLKARAAELPVLDLVVEADNLAQSREAASGLLAPHVRVEVCNAGQLRRELLFAWLARQNFDAVAGFGVLRAGPARRSAASPFSRGRLPSFRTPPAAFGRMRRSLVRRHCLRHRARLPLAPSFARSHVSSGRRRGSRPRPLP